MFIYLTYNKPNRTVLLMAVPWFGTWSQRQLRVWNVGATCFHIGGVFERRRKQHAAHFKAQA